MRQPAFALRPLKEEFDACAQGAWFTNRLSCPSPGPHRPPRRFLRVVSRDASFRWHDGERFFALRSIEGRTSFSLEAECHGLVADGAFIVEGDGCRVRAAQAGLPGSPRFLGGTSG